MAVRYIETQFLDGTLSGPRVMASSLCTMYSSPRDEVLDVVKDIPHRYGLYILLGKTDQGPAKAYIGQTKDFQQRVRGHLANKAFWDTALVFISNADRITSSEALYLEYLGIQKAIDTGSYNMDENAQVPPKPPIAIGKRIEMDQFFEEILFFLKFFGCEIFEKPAKKRRSIQTKPRIPSSDQGSLPTPDPIPVLTDGFREYGFGIKKVGMSARMRYYPQNKKYIVLKDSLIAATNAPSLQPSIATFRDDVFASPTKSVRKGNTYLLLEDIEIPNGSASAAAKFCAGTSRNGKTDWVDDFGQSIGSFLDGQ